MSKRILVIDDDQFVRSSFEIVLQDENYDVDTCESGMEGVERLKNDDYDLVFLDLKMPVMNGAETLREIRKVNDTVTVLIITAFHEEFFDEIKLLTEDGYSFELMRKPLDRHQIIQIVKSYLNHPEIVQA